ncbi:MAG: RDD family protein [Dehalococcoidia bacterium]
MTTDRTEIRVPSSFDYGVTGQRIVAALLDLVPLTALFLLMAAAFGDLGEGDDGQFSVRLYNGPFVVYTLLVFAYYIGTETLFAATPGKLLLGLRVTRLDGTPYTFGAVLVRNLLRIVDALPVLYIVGLVTVAVTDKNQRVGDLAARTTVVRAA